MKIIYASSNKGQDLVEIKVDSDDYEFLSRNNWHIRSNGYAYTTFGKYAIAMHEMVQGRKLSGQMIDHINRDKLDNRKSNLRAVSAQQNALNRGKMKPAKRKYKSPYVGVFHKHNKTSTKYEAGISLKSRYFSLNRYDTELEAAMVRDAFAYMVHGDLAFLNFPDKVDEYRNWQFPDRIMKRYEKWK